MQTIAKIILNESSLDLLHEIYNKTIQLPANVLEEAVKHDPNTCSPATQKGDLTEFKLPGCDTAFVTVQGVNQCMKHLLPPLILSLCL